MTNEKKHSKYYDIILLTSYPKLDTIAAPYIKQIESKHSLRTTKYKSLYIIDEDIVKDDEGLVIEFFMQTYGKSNKGVYDYIKVPIIKERKAMEQEIYQKLLSYYKGNREELCKDYGISRATLWRKLNSK